MSEKKSVKAEAVAPEPQKFGIPVLRKSSVRLFGVTSSTFDGAMWGRTGSFTVEEASKIIEAWKKGVAK